MIKKVMKQHSFNFEMYDNGHYFNLLVFATVLLITMNFVTFSVFQRYFTNHWFQLTGNWILYSVYALFIMALSNAARVIVNCIYLIKEDEIKDKMGQKIKSYRVLHNILPVGRKQSYLGGVLYAWLVGVEVWIISFIPLFIHIFLGSELIVEFLKLHFLIYSIVLLAVLGIGSTPHSLKYNVSYFVGFGVYLLIFRVNIDIAIRYWLLIPGALLVVIVSLLAWRYMTIENTDALRETSTYATRRSLKTLLLDARKYLSNRIKGDIKETLVVNKLMENKFIIYMPIFTLIASVLHLFDSSMYGYVLLFSFTLVIKLFMYSSRSESGNGNHLILIKSLPLEKEKVVKGIVLSTMLSIAISLGIILLISFLSTSLGLESHNLILQAYILLTLLTPVAITAIFWMVPTAILRGYTPKKTLANKFVLAYLLLLTGPIIAGIGEYSTRYLWVSAVVSILLYKLAISSVKKTYKYLVYLLTDPLRS